METFGLTPGVRVVIRYRIDADPHPLTDAIGTITSWEGGHDGGPVTAVTLLTKRGEVKIPAKDVVAVKRLSAALPTPGGNPDAAPDANPPAAPQPPQA